MSDFRMVSPLLDGYTVDKTVMTQRDRTWYSVTHIATKEQFVLKHLSVPASDAQVRALILSGIYTNENDVLAYYTALVSDIKQELELGKKLSETECFAGPVDYQIVQKTDSIGYDIYILQSLQIPLNELISRNGMTHLRAINLGIDICDAIIACRDAGYLFANLKPDNIFLLPSGKFMLGDLGLVPLKDLEYASISEDYIGSFSPPELFDISGIPNLTLDLYSLGMVLYRIYNGNHGPFEDENTDEAMADKLRLSGKSLPTPIYADYELAGIITRACSYRIPNRYSSPEQLKEDLLHYLQRNQIPDSLIVPPLVVDPEPIVEEEPEIVEEEPLRMVDAAELDAAFKASFAPSSENVGNDVPTPPANEPKEEPKEELKEELKAAPTAVPATTEHTHDEAPLVVNAEEKNQAEPAVQTPVVEDAPDAMEAPSTEEAPAAEKAPVTEEVPAAEKAPATEEAPATEKAPATEEAPATEKAPATEEVPAAEKAPVTEEAPATEKAPAAEEAPAAEKAEETDSAKTNKEELLSANAVSGPKMPTGNLRMSKKGKRSRRHKNLVLEIPQDPADSNPDEQETESPVAVHINDAAPKSSASKDTESPSKGESSSKEKSSNFSFSQGSEPSHTSQKDEEMDIDSLIASVNEVVGTSTPGEHPQPEKEETHALTMHVAPADSGYYDPYHDPSQEAQEVPEEKKASKWLPITIVAILTVALIGVIAFLLNNYYVDITALNLLSHSTEDLTVELVTPDAQECFIVTCTDNYGNSYPRTINGSNYTFSGLRENTAYTVTVIASEYHRLRSGKSCTITVKTPGTTKISDFSARRGTQAGDIVLNFTSEGPSPEVWQYTYTDANGVLSGPFPFNDHTALVAGLKEGVTYSFSIEAPRDLFLSGETTVEYTLLPIVNVTALHIEDVHDRTVSIAWGCEENFPETWTVTCEGGDYSKTMTTADLNISFTDLPDLERAYTFSVSALGMDEPAVLELPANPVILEDLKAEYQEDGTVKVSWDTPAGVPTSGWHLTYNTVGNLHVPYLVRDITSDSVTLTGLIPNAEYEITLHLTAEDASLALFGETSTTLITPVAEAFNGYDIDPAPVFGNDSGNLSLWLCPEKEDWTYTDLEKTRTEFTKDEKIAVCLQVESISASEDTVSLMYVIRNEAGQVVTDETQEFTWDSLWFERRHANAVPLPKEVGESNSVPGKYTLEVYINGLLLLQRDFTIV